MVSPFVPELRTSSRVGGSRYGTRSASDRYPTWMSASKSIVRSYHHAHCVVYTAHIMSTGGTPRTRALVRAIDVLRAVAAQPASSASTLARVSGLPRSTVARTLRTLADGGMVEEAPGGWVVGRELIELARTADTDRHL